ncbi:MAG TPA: RNA polymerase sigma factor [Alphaproteobacteria bacterium]|nr:RNA polymerase sigma factor [Alphaproteobacteria bacterium]
MSASTVAQTNRFESFKRALLAQLPALRRFAAALTGSVEMGDDLVQDCLERALKEWGSLKEEARLAGWLRSIVHNLYMDELRRRQRRGISQDITTLVDDSGLSVPASDLAGASDLMNALRGLSVEHRQILLLVGFDGLSYGEIAKELRIPIGTVMSRLARARERLRVALEIGTKSEAPTDLSAYRRSKR